MNTNILNLITRPYQEIADDVLTAIAGGIVNEPVIYDVKSDLYPLSRPSIGIRGITGTAADQHYTFRIESDFLFSEGDNAVVWQEGGTKPDDETVFYVDYFLPDSFSPLTDINVGSVTRTVGEAISREVAVVYEQINQAYRSGFIDLADGKALDFVVAILGITRQTKEYARGVVTFFRDPQVDGNITIEIGTTLLMSKGDARFETIEQRTLQRGQVRIDVPVRATRDFKGPAGRVEAGKIDTLLSPIAGIDRVVNFDATILGAQDETDDQLRERAKAVLRALGKGTLMALARVIREGHGNPVEFWDPNSPLARSSPPGKITILVEAEPERMSSLLAVVHETRAAGVQATLIARYVFFKPRVRLTVSGGLTPAGQNKVVGQVIAAVQAYVDGLSSGQPAEGQELLKAMRGVADVRDARMADVVTWRSDLGRPGAETLVEAVLAAMAGAGLDEAAQRAAILAAIEEQSPALTPNGRRIPDRSLLQGPDGGRATDAQLESGDFRVAAMVNGEPWWVVLDLEAADIAIKLAA